MLSSFLKKLLFTRQFLMVDGRIEILGKNQVMLPADVVDEIQKQCSKQKLIKESIKKDLEYYAKKVGGSEEGMLKNVEYIFDTFGLGGLEIMDMDRKNKRSIIRIHNPHLKNNLITSATLSGIFSFLFEKDVDAELKRKSEEIEEYIVR